MFLINNINLAMINLNRLAYFSAVITTGSFTRAAERLGVTKAVVSQQVAQLEAEVGATLLIRSTRKVQSTEAGQLLYDRCTIILREAEDAYSELSQSTAEPRGVLRVAAPNDYGTEIIVPTAVRFSKRYPACKIELLLGDKQVDLAAGDADMAIRVGWLADSALQARKIGSFQQKLVASPIIHEQLGAIIMPSELSGMSFVANQSLREPLLWHFSRNELERQDVRMTPSLSMDATPAVLRAVREGAGISVLPDFLVEDLLASNELIHILPDWKLPTGGIHAVYPAARFRPAKVTAFVSMLAEAERKRRS